MCMVQKHRREYPTSRAAAEFIIPKISCVPQMLLKWVKHEGGDASSHPGMTSSEAQRIGDLGHKNKKLRRANEVLQITPSSYRHDLACQRNPPQHSARARRDEQLIPHIEHICRNNFQVYGVDKIWGQLRCEPVPMACYVVERLMLQQGLSDVARGKVEQEHTTVTNPNALSPFDRVQCVFKVRHFNQLWVSDFACVFARQGFVYMVFVTDVFGRCIVSWLVSRSMHANCALHALEQALHAGQSERNNLLVHHFDYGAQYVPIRYTERLTEAGIEPSVSGGDDRYLGQRIGRDDRRTIQSRTDLSSRTIETMLVLRHLQLDHLNQIAPTKAGATHLVL